MQEVYCLQNVRYCHILSIPALNIRSGSLFWISGPSGGGKTTFLKLLNNMITCDQGRILYLDKDVLQYSPAELRQRAVMVSQTPFIFPGTVIENIQLVFYFNRKEVVSQVMMEELLSHFGMSGTLWKSTHNMSGGEKQRLALVRALLLEPETLRYQIIIMMGILGSVALSVYLIIKFGYRTFFNERAQLDSQEE